MNNQELPSSIGKSVRRHYEPEFIQQVLVGVYQSGLYATVED